MFCVPRRRTYTNYQSATDLKPWITGVNWDNSELARMHRNRPGVRVYRLENEVNVPLKQDQIV